MARIVREAGNQRRRGLGRDRHPAVPGAQARRARGQRHDPRGAPAHRRVPGAARSRGDRRDPRGLSQRARLRRRAVGRADERRARDPSAADGDERGAAAALRALGHPQRRHAAGGARRHRPARPGAHRGARSAGLRRAALPAGRPLQQRPLDVRRRAQEAGQVRRLARAHRPAHPPLHHRGHRARPGVPGVGGALERHRRADRQRPAGHRRRLPRARPAPRPAHARGAGPGRLCRATRCCGNCTRAPDRGPLCRCRRRSHGTRHRDRVRLCRPPHRAGRPAAALAPRTGSACATRRANEIRASLGVLAQLGALEPAQVDVIAARVELVDAQGAPAALARGRTGVRGRARDDGGQARRLRADQSPLHATTPS